MAALAIGLLLILIGVLMATVDLEAAISGAVWISGVIVVSYFFLLASLRREGFSRSRSHSVIWREPSWWLFWYPRALRRHGNVWDRLPAAIHHFRTWNGALFLISFVITALGWLSMGKFDVFSYVRDPNGFISMSAIAVALVLWCFLRFRAIYQLESSGVAPGDTFRVILSVPPSRAGFWSRPHIAAILAPPRPDTTRHQESPHDHMQSILRHADELSGPFRPLGAQAAVAARQLVASIDLVDREIADLTRSIEAGEEERLLDKIRSLAAASGDESIPMQTLFEKQLELIRALSARIEEAKDRRHRRTEMLRALALHVASLRARLTETPSELRQISDNVRSLCDDIGRQAVALDQRAIPTEVGGDELATVRKI